MSNRRTTIRRAVTSAFALAALTAPAQASVNPLLSGYGGPGQGSQVILGATLLGPPGGGSGPRQGATVASELTVPPPARVVTAPPAPARPSSHHARAPVKRLGAQARRSVPAPTAAQRLIASPRAGMSAASGGALGLSGGELLLIVFVLAAMLTTGALTRQLTRGTP